MNNYITLLNKKCIIKYDKKAIRVKLRVQIQLLGI